MSRVLCWIEEVPPNCYCIELKMVNRGLKDEVLLAGSRVVLKCLIEGDCMLEYRWLLRVKLDCRVKVNKC